MKISAHGLTVSSSTPLDARIYRRQAVEGDRPNPILHLCTVAMPDERGDYGGGAVDRLGPNDVFISLVEFNTEDASTALFSTKGRPTQLDPETFDPNGLQRVQSGQSGAQFWFTEAGRPFCLYVVLGSHANRRKLAAKATQMIAALQISPHGGLLKGPAPTTGRAFEKHS